MKATCCWGEGPDVMLELKGSFVMLYEKPSGFDQGIHGFVSEGSLEMTAKEARELAAQLTKAADESDEWDRKSTEDFERWEAEKSLTNGFQYNDEFGTEKQT